MPVFKNIKAYKHFFLDLIDKERKVEMAFHLNEIKNLSGVEREAKGRAVLNLTGKSHGKGIGNISLVRLSRTYEITSKDIGIGDLVILSTGNPYGDEMHASVVEYGRFNITVAYVEDPPFYAFGGGIRLDKFANDISFQRMQDAVHAVSQNNTLHTWLFELKDEIPDAHEADKIDNCWNERVNSAQKESIQNTLNASDFHLIHGPPGTGKTTTLAESILQHVKRGQSVLATADSNVAVDNLIEKLLYYDCRVIRIGNPARMDPKLEQVALDYQLQQDSDYAHAGMLRDKIVQLRAFQKDKVVPNARNRRGIPDEQLLKLAKQGLPGRGISPGKIKKMASWLKLQSQINQLYAEIKDCEDRAVFRLIRRAEVVCCTNVTSGSEVLADFNFDVCFIDEATQAVEPSCLIPMVKACKWILAGDHKQLPPTVLSKQATDLTYSIFERLMDWYGSNRSSLLSIQYRMNDRIMEFSNLKFYQGKLDSADLVRGHVLSDLPGIIAQPKTNTIFNQVNNDEPVVVVDVPDGVEAQVPDGFSYKNDIEATLVLRAVENLLFSRVFPQDIGVISPYDYQVNILKEKLDQFEVEVKTVDGYQGREKEVIILSLVRSNKQGQLGFLQDYRRLNVALTRARRKLIIIANIATLSHDPIFRNLFQLYLPAHSN